MRGVVDDSQLMSMSGTAPARVRRASWVIGTCFASMSGILFASNQAQLEINNLTLLVVQAFGAATIARFQSVPLAFVGGLAVGVLQKVVAKATAGEEQLQGLDLAVPFLVLFIGLLVIPRSKLVEVGRLVRARPPLPSVLPPQVRIAVIAGLGVFLLVLPHVVGARLSGYNTAMSQVTLFVSLHLLVRTSGQISLCHFGFAAVGAAGFGHMLGNGVPFYLAVVLGGVFCLPLALIVSVPAIRLSGLYLALATLGFGIVISQFAYPKNYMFGSGLPTERAPGFDSDTSYYYLLLAFAVAVRPAGADDRALADGPVAAGDVGLADRPHDPGHLGRGEPGAGVLHLRLPGRHQRRPLRDVVRIGEPGHLQLRATRCWPWPCWPSRAPGPGRRPSSPRSCSTSSRSTSPTRASPCGCNSSSESARSWPPRPRRGRSEP